MQKAEIKPSSTLPPHTLEPTTLWHVFCKTVIKPMLKVMVFMHKWSTGVWVFLKFLLGFWFVFVFFSFSLDCMYTHVLHFNICFPNSVPCFVLFKLDFISLLASYSQGVVTDNRRLI